MLVHKKNILIKYFSAGKFNGSFGKPVEKEF